MILNRTNLNQLMSVDEQESEIKRIQDAEKGATLFTACTSDNQDKIKTLLHRSHVLYYEAVAGNEVEYIKG